MPFVSGLDDNALIVHAFGLIPEHSRYIIPYIENLLRGDSPLSVAERELIGAYSSGLNDCTYCYGAHAQTAKQFGVDVALFEALFDDIDSAPVDDKMKPILRYVKKLTLTPSKMTEADAEAIYAAGWPERALIDAVLVCAQFAFFNRFVEGLGLNASKWQAETSGERLGKNGYHTVAQMMGFEVAE